MTDSSKILHRAICVNVAGAVAISVLANLAAAQETKPSYDAARAEIAKAIEQHKTAAAGNADILVLDQIVADRKQQKVTIFGAATGISATEAVEFFVAAMSSGKDYEALSVTWAKPSDVHKALEFIGLKPGHPVNYEKNHHWGRGPRVIMSIDAGNKPTRVEDMVFDNETKKTLPRAGLVFTGSFTVTDEAGVKRYAADEADSKPIAPDYNEPAAVLDLPRRVSQAAVYGFQRPEAKHLMKQGQLVRITLEPAKGEEAVNSRDLKVQAAVRDGQPVYTLNDGDKKLVDAAPLPHLVTAIGEQAKTRDDLFTVVAIDPAMKVNDVRKLYAVLMALEQDRGVKIDPPAEGQLFHRAFFPDEEWRNREERLGEPWELFLDRKDQKLVGRLERLVENFEPDAEQKQTLQRHDIATPDAYVKICNDNPSQWTKAIFIFPPDDISYGELLEWAGPALPTFPRIFVFAPKPGGATQPVGNPVIPATSPTTNPTTGPTSPTR